MSVVELMPWQESELRDARSRPRLAAVSASDSPVDVARRGLTADECRRFDRMLAACGDAESTIDLIDHCVLAARRRPA